MSIIRLWLVQAATKVVAVILQHLSLLHKVAVKVV
jgi:hypothetical protein